IIQIICMLFYKLFDIKIRCGFYHTCLIFDKQLYAWGSNGYGQLGLGHNQNQNSPQKLNLPPVKKIICGSYHSVAITITNEVYVWGSNQYGQLGLGHNQHQNSPQKLNLPAGEEKVRNSPFSNLAGKSSAFSSPVKKIICGSYHSIAVT